MHSPLSLGSLGRCLGLHSFSRLPGRTQGCWRISSLKEWAESNRDGKVSIAGGDSEVRCRAREAGGWDGA